jgi:hypothetical protein
MAMRLNKTQKSAIRKIVFAILGWIMYAVWQLYGKTGSIIFLTGVLVFIIATRLQAALAVRIVFIVYLILLQLVVWFYGVRGILVIGLLIFIGIAIYDWASKKKKRIAAGPLRQAIDLARAGKKDESRSILAELIRSEPQNELAWIWYADTWADTETRVQALERGLEHNPNSQKIGQALQVLRKQEGRDVERR